MKLNIYHCVLFFPFALWIPSVVNGTKYKFQSNIVQNINEEIDSDGTIANLRHSCICQSLMKADKLTNVCKMIVDKAPSSWFHQRIKFVKNQQPSLKIISINSFKGTNKRVSACQCPTNIPIYLTDGESANTIKVIVRGYHPTYDPNAGMSLQNRNKEEKLKYIRYLKYLRMLKRRKHKKKYNFDFATDNQNEGLNFDLVNLSDLASGGGDSGFLDGINSFFSSLDLGGLDFGFNDF